ncbi:hypothetical protein [Nocardia macrotermitis]|uniref:Uncharacterized protein n=1 Tax=Nocardia macrotermitis TaxID=2585198 RepID=A0A7K0D194_9NOCA|nr:hypothetical protein [Nocardia macrotermitis]MQY19490.1 hypothetical protein [Nocardia macrotermitis]
MNGDNKTHLVRDELRRIASYDHATLDAVAAVLDDREINVLAGRLGMLAAHLASRAGLGRGMPPPGTFPGAGSERIDLAAQWNAVTVAGWFVRRKLTAWWWYDLLFDGVLVTYELVKAFVTAVAEDDPSRVTRLTLRLRALSAGRLVIEVHDSPENAHLISAADNLISTQVQHVAHLYGRHEHHGRTVLWCELARPELTRWI